MTTTTTYFPTYPVDGPPPIPPVTGLLAAADAPAAGVRIVVDTTAGPVPENSIAPSGAGLEEGLYRTPDGRIMMRQPGVAQDTEVYVPPKAGLERWLAGVALWPYPAETPEGWDGCPSSTLTEKSFGGAVTPPGFRALTIDLPITCTAQQVPDEAAFRARAVAVLAATESWRVARELMAGLLFPDDPHFADTNATTPNGAVATKPNHGLQVLEEAIAATGRLGLIHCSPMLATALMGGGFALSDKSGVIRTINGNVVIADGGYAGASALHAASALGATQEWAYATGPIDVRRSEIFTSPDTRAEALDRGPGLGATNGRTNTFTYRAERYYVAVWDTTLQAAVLIDRCATDCGVGS